MEVLTRTYEHKLIYSLKWSKNIYKRLKEKYPRATKKVCEIYEINAEQPAIWLAMGIKPWRIYKRAVKIWENWYISQDKMGLNTDKLLNNCIVEFKELINNIYKY